MNFSRNYKTFEDWLNNFRGSDAYRNRIIREHGKFPKASLSQLRGHASKGKRSISELKPQPVFKRPWNSISRKELNLREKSLEVLRKVRKGQSLNSACKELHTSSETVIKNTGAFKKVHGKWTAKSYDRISRVMSIYEDGKQKWVEVRDSRIASRIGKYNSAVNEFIRTGNPNVLKQFRKPFKDANGKLRYFEIDPDRLYEIAEQQEEPEFYEIYKV